MIEPPKVAVVWRKGEGKHVSKEVEKELGEIAGALGGSPERVMILGGPYPPTSAPRVWESADRATPR